MSSSSSRRLVRLSAAAIVAVLGLPVAARAQEAAASSQAAPAAGTGFETHGSVSVGYRSTDISGYEPKYRELYDLRSGLRVPDVNLFARAPQGSDRFADTFSFSASGLGGDPYQASQLTARKRGLYDFRANFRRSRFFWDQSDATLPNGANGLTNNHAWDTVRTFGSVNLQIRPSNALRAGFQLSRSGRDGTQLTTRAVDFFGSPSSWGSFARANPYSMVAPVHEASSRYTGSVDYTLKTWTVHYVAGYQVFDDAVTANALAEPERSINVDDAVTAKELLDSGSYQDYRRLTTPVSEFSFEGRPAPRIQWHGGYSFYRYEGPAGLQAAYKGTARTTGTNTAPYTVALDTRADLSEPMHVLDQGVTWEANDWVNVVGGYRYEWIGIDSTADFTSVYNSTLNTGETTSQWRQHRNQIDAAVQVMPRADLLLRGGLQYLQNDIRVLADGTVDDVRTRTINSVRPTFSASWKPHSMIAVRADLDTISNDVSYTRLTPKTTVGSRIQVEVRPTDQISVVDAVNLRHQTLDEADYTANVRANALTATYQFSENLALFGGYTFDRFKSTGTTTFLRGTPPLSVDIVNEANNHIWQGGASAKPTSHFGFSVAGNYIKTTGEGTIAGETPYYGPLTHRYVTSTVFYEFPPAGRLSLDLTRTHYGEDLVPLNDFEATLVMVRWTRSF
jgi:hypothetical protein